MNLVVGPIKDLTILQLILSNHDVLAAIILSTKVSSKKERETKLKIEMLQ